MRVIRGLSSGLSSSYAMKVASYMVALDFFPNLTKENRRVGQRLNLAEANAILTLDYEMIMMMMMMMKQ